MGLFSRRNPYDEMMGAQYLKILKESVDIFNTTKNPDTFFQRYALAEENAQKLCKLKGVRFTGQQPNQIVKQLSDKKQAAIRDMLGRYFDDTVNKASKVKTSKSKLGKINLFITALEKYFPIMDDSNVQYVNELYSNATQYISIDK